MLYFDKNYTLSINTERKLAGTLTYLAHNKDDVDHIPAICLAQDPYLGLLNVLVAVNNSSSADGHEAFIRVKEAFENIFATLAKISDSGWPMILPCPKLTTIKSNGQTDIQNKVLTAVISMCSSRILSRLRLSTSRKKRSFKEVLQEAVLAVNRITSQKLEDKGLVTATKQFTAKVKEVRKLLDSWSRYQVGTQLMVEFVLYFLLFLDLLVSSLSIRFP
jgi:hypothetical protein